MREFSRREFVAGSLGGLIPMATGTERAVNESIFGGDGATIRVSSRRELERAFENLSSGDTIVISPEGAPYRTTEWLDVDANGVTVQGPGIKNLIRPADGANAGGIRIGHNSACEGISVRGIGYHGNPAGQDDDVLRLHGIVVREARDVTLANNYITKTHPYHVHGRGGSGISVELGAVGVRIQNNRIYDIGDRGVQLAGQGILVSGNVITRGLDRSVSMDLWPTRARMYQARNVSVVGNYLGNNSEGSLTGVGGAPRRSNRGYYTIANNVGFGLHKCFCHLGFRGHAENVAVVGNVSVRGDGSAQREAGINLNATNVRNVIVANNELYDYALNGIHVDSGVREFTVANNLVTSPGEAGIRVAGRHGTVAGNSVVRPARQGIYLRGATNVSVDGNRVRGAGLAGIAVRGEDGPGNNRIHGNHVFSWGREKAGVPAIVVRTGQNSVTNNFVRDEEGDEGPAIDDRMRGSANVYADNYATGDGAWIIRDPTATVRDMTPPIDVHRGRDDDDRDGIVNVSFDRPYAERPPLRFGERGGGITSVEYETDSRGDYVGVSVEIAEEGGRVDLFVGD